MIRQPVVAGQFYSSNRRQLRTDIERYLSVSTPKEKVIGIIAPHAGYMYSGAVAGAVYSAVEIPDTVIILGPNHSGIGARVAIYREGEWVTPLGSVNINTTLAGLIMAKSPMVEEDTSAHHFEHSLEVQLPFLQYINPDVTIVPLCIGPCNYAACKSIGTGLAKAIKDYGKDVLIVASSDMTHYESADSARRKDQLAINEVLALNPEGLLNICRNEAVSMCGVIPATIMLIAALEFGATHAKLVKYATSGDVTGDATQVVAYAAIALS
jgi:AmmeMemoRadiSam system protein B